MSGSPSRLLADLLTAPDRAPAESPQVWAARLGIRFLQRAELEVPPELFDLIPAAEALSREVVPLRRIGTRLEVALADPFDLDLIDRLERLTGLNITPALAAASDIRDALKHSQGTADVLRDVSEDFRVLVVRQDDDGMESAVLLEENDDASAPVVRLVNMILRAALQKRASDVHIEAFEQGTAVKYRIDGVLYPATEHLDRSHHATLISRLKIMAQLDIAEKRVPQDGRFKLRIDGADIDFRVSVLPSVFGEDVVIRILDKTAITKGLKSLDLDAIGLPEDSLARFRQAVREPYGMVLITGPTGSGKTTTLYAALTELHTGEEKIITIEDPVEYQLDGIVQVPVNEKKNLTFAQGLRSILRHDPDKIMVGEIRDAETARIAVQSALTGHLVFTTVHANNVFDVLSRFTHMGIDAYSFVSALNCVMAQRLIRLLCVHCKRPERASPELLRRSGLADEHYADHTWYAAVGCPHCSETGYHGRAAIAELLDLSPAMRELILERRPITQLKEAAAREGMRSLRQAALARALAGDTTLHEINRVTFVD